jgi:hypothetical protein
LAADLTVNVASNPATVVSLYEASMQYHVPCRMVAADKVVMEYSNSSPTATHWIRTDV